MIRTLLFAENRFTASTFFSKLHLQLWGVPLRCHLKSYFCQAAIADPNGGPYFDILQTVLLLSIFQWFNLIIYSLNTYRLTNCYDTMCSN